MLNRACRYCIRNLEQEYDCRALWYPVLVGVGILLYYGGLSSYFLMALLVFLFRSRSCLILCGFLAMHLRVVTINTVMLDEPIYVHNAIATVQQINYQEKSIQLILKNIQHKKIINISKVRLKTYKLSEMIKAGDRVLFSAKLLPAPNMTSPYGYNFASFAYFEGISAIGFVTSMKFLSASQHHFGADIDIIRNYISKSFVKMIGPKNGNIAAALIVGKRDGIESNIMSDVRKAGLAHLLAISGLHLTIIAFFFFIISRKLLALSIFIATKYNIKKCSAICGLVFGGCYLILSGMSISAQRSYIMVAIVHLAILFDRNSSTMRSISLAAFIILLLEPESLFKPSFQMSFAAVIGLCSFFEWYSVIYVNNIFYRVFDYFKAIVLSSLVAGLATTPYTIYHFNYFSLGGIISNLVAIPIATMVILPAGIISTFLMPFSLGYLPAFIMSKGIDLILSVSHKVANSEYSSIPIHTFDHVSILMISFGFLWLCLWRRRWRFYGIPIMIGGFICGLSYQTADVWVNGKMVAVKGGDGKLYFLNKQRKSFVSKAWIAQNGQQQILFYPQHCNDKLVSILCQANYCQYYNHGKSVLFLYGPSEISFNDFDYVIQLNNDQVFENKKLVPYGSIAGGYFLWLRRGENITLQSVH